ncbi:PQQ-dependent dehydrogenase, methanol/ethanol family [Calidithermus chliarophilus]|uniref:PQQ-dependent dehydrogenase, methanol/ethanol family n=1 Tax=Calidithermus chliarophilus TaxID=52023 RepID=UPI00040BE099|nr:PQQ-dependent dehydrogenase, methanol/ethanol family [Calidithermus chliarophilus]
MRGNIRGIFLAAAVSLLGWAMANPELVSLQRDQGQWVMTGRSYDGLRYSPLSQINTLNARRLQVAWTFALGVQQDGVEGEPLVIGDTMYIMAPYPNQVYALDLRPGREGVIKWMYEPKQNEKAIPVTCCGLMSRGWSYAQGKIIIATLDGQLIALDAKTGKEVWKAQNGDIEKQEVQTAPAIIAGNTVIVGMAGGEFGNRGHVTGYDLATGQRKWRGYSMGPDADMLIGPNFKPFYPDDQVKSPGTATWFGDSWQRGTGTTWGYITYDPELNLIYYGTSNGGPWNPKYRRDPNNPDPFVWSNKYVASVLARNPDTGELIWAYQFTPQEQWDYDEVGDMNLVDLNIGGQTRKALVHAGRNGFFFVLDRATGELLSAKPYVETNWASGYDLKTGRPVFNKDKLLVPGQVIKDICPYLIGGKNFQPASYSPRTGLFYFTTVLNICMDQEAIDVDYKPGERYIGVRSTAKFLSAANVRSALMAWDPVNQREAWSVKEPFHNRSGTVVTAGDLVFYGTVDGYFKAVHARTGQVLWQFRTGAGTYANPMTYLGPDGKQYVAILVGSKGFGNRAIDLDDVGNGTVGAFQRKGNFLFVFHVPN